MHLGPTLLDSIKLTALSRYYMVVRHTIWWLVQWFGESHLTEWC